MPNAAHDRATLLTKTAIRAVATAVAAIAFAALVSQGASLAVTATRPTAAVLAPAIVESAPSARHASAESEEASQPETVDATTLETAGSLDPAPEPKTRPAPPEGLASLRGEREAYVIRKVRRAIGRFPGGRDLDPASSSCAVVGNSGGALRGRGHGASIDGHDAVFRVNNAPTAGFERDVGAKTNASFVNGHILHACRTASSVPGVGSECGPCWPYDEGGGVLLVAYLVEAFHIDDADACGRINAAHGGNLHVVDRQMMTLCDRIVRPYASENIPRTLPRARWREAAVNRRKVRLHFSTGVQAVVFALALCRNVTLYGFGQGPGEGGQGDGVGEGSRERGRPPAPSSSWHHYFENETVEEYLDHDYAGERLFLHDLGEGNPIHPRLLKIQPMPKVTLVP